MDMSEQPAPKTTRLCFLQKTQNGVQGRVQLQNDPDGPAPSRPPRTPTTTARI